MTRNIVVTLECFVKKGDKYLMLHRGIHKRIMPDIWMAPGGHREFNEGLFECARREVLEETGLTIKNIKVKAIGNAFVKDIDQEFFFHMLLADYAGGKLRTSDADGTFSWLTKEEIIKLDKLLPELKHVIPHIFSNSSKIISYKAYYEKGTEMSLFELEQS
ncbi:NUDIX domain-containing protein [Candidatus Roizmanbacteria bacterium]|nr:NUDIX domain-containing protein [Candidatus Roizmanbacteria bacterium]